MNNFKILILLVLFSGCANVEKNNPFLSIVDNARNADKSNNGVIVKGADKISLRAVGRTKEKLYKIEIGGKMTLSAIVAYLCDVTGMSSVSSAGLDTVVELRINDELTLNEIRTIINKILLDKGYKVVYNNNTMVLEKTSSTVSTVDYYFRKLKHLQNKYSFADESVKTLVIGGGIMFYGEKMAMDNIDNVIDVYDRDVLDGKEIIVFNVSAEVCEKALILFRELGVNVKSYPVNDSLTYVVLYDEVYKARIITAINNMIKTSYDDYYYVEVSLDTDSLKSMIDNLLKINYSVYARGVLVKGYENYRKLLSMLSKINAIEHQLHIKLYILDVVNRKMENIGLDVNYKSGDFEITNKIAKKLGGSVTAGMSDLDLYASYLLDKYNGRVVASPHYYTLSGSLTKLNFGQSVPTIQSANETTGGGLVQNVQYMPVGLLLNLKADVVGDTAIVDIDISNSSVMESSGVGGNPQFLRDNLNLKMVCELGKFTVIGGLFRKSVDKGKAYGILSFNRNERFERRELILCLQVDDVKVEQDVANVKRIVNSAFE